MDRSSHSSNGSQGHSAEVQILLHTPLRTIRLVQAGPKAIKPAGGESVPAGAATLEVLVDGCSHRRNVTVTKNGQPGEWAKLA